MLLFAISSPDIAISSPDIESIKSPETIAATNFGGTGGIPGPTQTKERLQGDTRANQKQRNKDRGNVPPESIPRDRIPGTD